MRYLIIVLLSIVSYCNAEWFAYDRAIRDVQRNDLPKAMQRLNASLIDHPDDTSLLYDAGVVAYKSNDFNQARDYFNRATQSKDGDAQLQKQAYFNSGNASVALTDYKNAVLSYEQALHIDPSDERVQHNLKKARELLRQQQKEQQDKKDEKQDEDKKQQNKDKNQSDKSDEKSDQDRTQDKQDDNKNASDQKQSSQQQQDTDKDQKSDKQDKQEPSQKPDKGQKESEQKSDQQKQQSGQEDSGEKRDQGSDQQNGQGQDQQDSGADRGKQEKQRERGKQPNHEPGDQSDDTHEQGQRDKGNQEKPDRKPTDTKGNESQDTAGDKTSREHEQTPSHKQQSDIAHPSDKNDTQLGDKAQAMEVKQGESPVKKAPKQEKKVDERLMWIMQEQERQDAQHAKGLIKGVVDKNLVGKHGQHCW